MNKLYKGIDHPFSNIFGVAGKKWLKSLKLSEESQFNLERYLKLIEVFDKLIKEADRKIERVVSNHPRAKLLTTIPGISYVSALSIIAEIGDINHFLTAKKLMGYAGLVPSIYASGEKISHGRITKQGSRWLRWTMIEVAQRQLLCKKRPGFGWYYYLKALIEKRGYLLKSKKEKSQLLDEYCQTTGQNRDYVIRKIRTGAYLKESFDKRKRREYYDGYVREALVKLWRIFDYPCGQRLKAILKTEGFLEKLREKKELNVSDEVFKKLKEITSSTIDLKLKHQKEIERIRKKYQ